MKTAAVLLCVLVLGGILVAGLWPFHAPSNGVTWLDNGNGLRFESHGTVLSSGSYDISSSRSQVSCSLEIWLQPWRSSDSSTILAFYTLARKTSFSLLQSDENLGLRIQTQGRQPSESGSDDVYVSDVFRDRRLFFITITSSESAAAVYVNGALVTTSRPFRLSPEDCTGKLVLGTSPVENSNWSGQVRGLAIYGHALTAAQVSRHLETWVRAARPDLAQNDQNLALYLFNEHQGRTVHDYSGSGNDLYIPERYMILDEKFLEPAWQEFRPGWSYCKNVGINIGGFIPLGLLFCAYLTIARQVRRPGLVTLILGAAVSLTIEVLQSYLPTRDSGMTDLITNTLGTGIGVIVYRWKASLLSKTLQSIRARSASITSTWNTTTLALLFLIRRRPRKS